VVIEIIEAVRGLGRRPMKAHIVGGGFGGLAAAALLIRNAGVAGADRAVDVADQAVAQQNVRNFPVASLPDARERADGGGARFRIPAEFGGPRPPNCVSSAWLFPTFISGPILRSGSREHAIGRGDVCCGAESKCAIGRSGQSGMSARDQA
jgi:hypothetical protein